MKDCVNFECKSTEDLKVAPLFASTFYGAPSHGSKLSKRRLICTPCYHAAVDRQEELANCLSERKPILEYENQFPSHSLQVEICDSDESDMEQEATVNSDYLPEDVLLDMEKRMENVIHSIFEKYDIKYQVEEACKTLKQQWNKIEGRRRDTRAKLKFLKTTEEINVQVKAMQCELDLVRNRLYDTYRAPNQSIPIWSEIVKREVKGTLLSRAPPAALELEDYLVVSENTGP